MVSEEKIFENVDGRTEGRWTTDDGVTGILIAHLGAFGSGELKMPTIDGILTFMSRISCSAELSMKKVL